MEAWEQNLRIASYDFQREVLPNMSASLPSGTFVSVEMEGVLSQTSTTGTAAVLDQDAGIDYLIRNPESGVTTVAARVSYRTSPPCASFTIGERELEKRRREHETEEGIGPYFTVQGTVSQRQTGTFVCGAVIATWDLISFVDNFPDLVGHRTKATTGRPFNVVWASDLLDQGFPVDVRVAPNAGRIVGWP